MRVLLDTCVLSELRHPNGRASVKAAVSTIAETDLFLSVITIGELAKGIALLEQSKRQSELSAWLSGLETHFADRIIGIDGETARLWGTLTAKTQTMGLATSAADGLIAATALRHGLHIMTRNVKDFEPTGALLLNPWDD